MTISPSTQRRRSTLLAVLFAAAGVAVVTVLLLMQELPSPWWLWVTFAVAFVALEFTAVEVNDGLLVSSSAMVVFTAAVVFGRDSAILAMVLMAAVAMLQPEDLRLRRWRQPLANFGQLVISVSAGTAVFSFFLPTDQVALRHIPLIALGAAVAAVVYNWVNFQLVSFYVRRTHPDLELRPWSRMLPNHTALALLSALGGLLGAAYLLEGLVVLPLIFITYLVGHVGFAIYARMRRTNEDTIRGFVKVVEALDPHTKGHTERVAHFCRITGERLGLRADRLERLRWAALIHDVGKLALPAAMLRKEEPLTDEELRLAATHMGVVDEVLADVDFLRPMVEISARHRQVLDRDQPCADASLEARILAAADAFDAMTSTRSYRAAVTQQQAFAVLRGADDRLGKDVVEGLMAAIEDRGETYGSPDDESSAEVARLVKERVLRA